MRICQYIATENVSEDRKIEILEARLRTLQNLSFNYSPLIRKVSGDYGYWHALAEDWDKGDNLVIIEHDMVPNVAHMQAFESCHYPFCTVPYKMPNGNWSLFMMDLNHMVGDYPLVIPYNMPVKWIEGSAIGLVRITKMGQKLIDLPRHLQQHWSLIDVWLSYQMKQTADIMWHVHYPPVAQIHS